jgi:hypothetical protein
MGWCAHTQKLRFKSGRPYHEICVCAHHETHTTNPLLFEVAACLASTISAIALCPHGFRLRSVFLHRRYSLYSYLVAAHFLFERYQLIKDGRPNVALPVSMRVYLDDNDESLLFLILF